MGRTMLPQLLLLFTAALGVESKVSVTITLGTFTARGLRCDWFLPCDFKFVVCVDDILTSSGNRMSPCTFASRSTPRMGAAPINLGNKLAPIVFQMDTWKGVRMKVRVLDHDQYSDDDEIDFLSSTYLGPIGRRMDVVMSHKTRLSVSYSSGCAPYYYGPVCSTLCVPQNNHFNGHYICEPILGTRLCLPGWTGVNCNETKVNKEMDNTTMGIPKATSKHSPPPPRTSKPFHPVSVTSATTIKVQLPNVTSTSAEVVTEMAPCPQCQEEEFNDTDAIISGDLDYALKKIMAHVNTSHAHPPPHTSPAHLLNHTRSWLCGRMNLMARGDLAPAKVDASKINQVVQSLATSGNISLSITLDQRFHCNGSAVDVMLVEYCWNSVQSRETLEHQIQSKFNDVFGLAFDFMDKELCVTPATLSSSSTQIMYSLWGSLAVLVLLVAVVVIIVYQRRKRCRSLNNQAKFLFFFRKAPPNAQQLASKRTDDKLNILPPKTITP